MTRYSPILLLFVFVVYGTAIADSDPKQFFDDDYVGSLVGGDDETSEEFDSELPIVERMREEAKRMAEEYVGDGSDGQQAEKFFGPSTDKNDTDDSAENKSDDNENSESTLLAQGEEDDVKGADAFYKRGIDIEAVSMVVSTQPVEHGYDSMKRFSDFVIEYDVRPNVFYALGNYNVSTDIPSDWIKIVARGGEISHSFDILKKYALKHSPAWVMHLKTGDIVIEGEENISRFLTPEGKFKQQYLREDKKGRKMR